MAKIAKTMGSPAKGASVVSRNERRILEVLAKICRRLERLEASAAGQRACRRVAQRLAAMLTEPEFDRGGER